MKLTIGPYNKPIIAAGYVLPTLASVFTVLDLAPAYVSILATAVAAGGPPFDDTDGIYFGPRYFGGSYFGARYYG